MEVKKNDQGEDVITFQLNAWDMEDSSSTPAIITKTEENISIEFDAENDPESRNVVIELQNGVVRVRSYNKSKDECLTVEIPSSGEIVINDHDYRNGVFIDDSPAP